MNSFGRNETKKLWKVLSPVLIIALVLGGIFVPKLDVKAANIEKYLDINFNLGDNTIQGTNPFANPITLKASEETNDTVTFKFSDVDNAAAKAVISKYAINTENQLLTGFYWNGEGSFNYISPEVNGHNYHVGDGSVTIEMASTLFTEVNPRASITFEPKFSTVNIDIGFHPGEVGELTSTNGLVYSEVNERYEIIASNPTLKEEEGEFYCYFDNMTLPSAEATEDGFFFKGWEVDEEYLLDFSENGVTIIDKGTSGNGNDVITDNNNLLPAGTKMTVKARADAPFGDFDIRLNAVYANLDTAAFTYEPGEHAQANTQTRLPIELTPTGYESYEGENYYIFTVNFDSEEYAPEDNYVFDGYKLLGSNYEVRDGDNDLILPVSNEDAGTTLTGDSKTIKVKDTGATAVRLSFKAVYKKTSPNLILRISSESASNGNATYSPDSNTPDANGYYTYTIEMPVLGDGELESMWEAGALLTLFRNTEEDLHNGTSLGGPYLNDRSLDDGNFIIGGETIKVNGLLVDDTYVTPDNDAWEAYRDAIGGSDQNSLYLERKAVGVHGGSYSLERGTTYYIKGGEWTVNNDGFVYHNTHDVMNFTVPSSGTYTFREKID